MFTFEDCGKASEDSGLFTGRISDRDTDRIATEGKICHGKPVEFELYKNYDQIIALSQQGKLFDGRHNPILLPSDLRYVPLASAADFDIIAARGRGRGSPSAAAVGGLDDVAISHIMADSFFAAKRGGSALAEAGIWSKPAIDRSTYMVSLNLDPKTTMAARGFKGAGNMYSETYWFYVEDRPAPQCKGSGAAMTCTFRMFIDAETQDFMGETMEAMVGVVTGRGQQMTADALRESRIRMTDSDRRYRFAWKALTVSFVKQGGTWRSPNLDRAFGKIVATMDDRRDAMWHGRRQAMDGLAQARSDATNSMCGSAAAGAVASRNFSMTDSIWYNMNC